MARREDRLARLAEAKAVLQARAQERAAAEQAEYEARMAQRAERERTTGRRPGGRPPAPPTPGPRDGDQYNYTDPESRIMKSSTHAGFEQDYNAQVAVDQGSLLLWGVRFPITRTIAKKLNPPSLLFLRRLVPRRSSAGRRLFWFRYACCLCQARHRAIHCHSPRSPSSQLAAAFCSVTRSSTRGREPPGENGIQAQD